MSNKTPSTDHEVANEVMQRLIQRAIKLSLERRLSAEKLNQGGWKSCLDDAFNLIDHAPFADREALSTAFSAAVDASRDALREQIAILRAREVKAVTSA